MASKEQEQEAPSVHIEAVEVDASDPMDGEPLKVLVGTWNVGNKCPPEGVELDHWIPHGGDGADIIVVGAQEARYKTPDESHGSDQYQERARSRSTVRGDAMLSNHFLRLIQVQAGTEYRTVATETLLEMRLIVLVHERHCSGLQGDALLVEFEVETRNEATGVAGVVGNKGGLLVKLNMHGTTFCFVSCHLAAHREQKHLDQRNSDCQEIMAGTRVGHRMTDLQQFDHVFWLGDLNYRIDLEMHDGQAREHDAHVQEVLDLIAEENWAALREADQLARELREHRCLYGFQEAAPPNWHPTFKMLRTAGSRYKGQRVPSWCDRILYKSLPGLQGDVTTLDYHGVPEIASSDHKPVVATFQVRIREPIEISSAARNQQFPRIDLSDVRCEGLEPMDLNGLADPYIIFHSSPPHLFGTKHLPQSQKKMKTLEPHWENHNEIPHLRPKVTSRDALARCHLIMSIVDYDFGNPDDPMGSATLDLGRFINAEGAPVEFSEVVTHDGVPAGSISGSITVSFPGNRGFGRETSTVMRDGGCNCVVQ